MLRHTIMHWFFFVLQWCPSSLCQSFSFYAFNDLTDPHSQLCKLSQYCHRGFYTADFKQAFLTSWKSLARLLGKGKKEKCLQNLLILYSWASSCLMHDKSLSIDNGIMQELQPSVVHPAMLSGWPCTFWKLPINVWTNMYHGNKYRVDILHTRASSFSVQKYHPSCGSGV